MITENVIKHFYFHIYFKKYFLKVDLKKTHYVSNHPKPLPNFSKHFIAQNPTVLKEKCIWWDLCVLVPQRCRLLLVHPQTPVSDMHLVSLCRETMAGRSAVQSLGIQLEAEIHPGSALNWEILPGGAVALAEA